MRAHWRHYIIVVQDMCRDAVDKGGCFRGQANLTSPLPSLPVPRLFGSIGLCDLYRALVAARNGACIGI
jgi:hypothetical protein